MKQPFLVIIVAAVAFIIVMSLMLLAVRRSPSEVAGNLVAQSEEPPEEEEQANVANVVAEDLLPSLRTTATGIRELEIRGYVNNRGKLAVRSADLRCYFRTRSGGEASFDFPLIVDSRLEEVGGGPLMPLTRKEFGVRMGEFPDTVEPEIIRTETTNVRFLVP
ncbi:hypothetical protein HZA56_05955 [Candidatus Poribacteria bacterium]|nr:hypothetical protein [Candidatus Poribacteria bacterium]